MSPLLVPKHQWLGVNLATEFRLALKGCKQCKTYQPIDYRVTDDTILQPDMLVICGEITKKYLDFPPALAAEILSPSTALKDKHSKFSIYEKQGIPYYIIISPETEEIEIYQLSGDSTHSQQKAKTLHLTFLSAHAGPASILVKFGKPE